MILSEIIAGICWLVLMATIPVWIALLTPIGG